MILLDAGALVSFFVGEPSAPEVKRILETGHSLVAAPNLAEAIDILVRVLGNDLDDVETRLIPVLVTNLPVLSIGEGEARRGAELRIRHYHRQHSPLSLADCLLLASADLREFDLATSDPHVARVGRTEGLQVMSLCDSSGNRP